MEQLLTLRPGTVLLGRVVRMEPFGAFVDIGRGIVALLPTEYISAARIPHPSCRFREGQRILAVLRSADDAARRITLTHRELLGTWLENASRFAVGETVPGIVRGVQGLRLLCGADAQPLRPDGGAIRSRPGGRRVGDHPAPSGRSA